MFTFDMPESTGATRLRTEIRQKLHIQKEKLQTRRKRGPSYEERFNHNELAELACTTYTHTQRRHPQLNDLHDPMKGEEWRLEEKETP